MDQIPLIASTYPFPPLSARTHITARTFPYLITPGPPVLLFAYLARQPNTLALRLALLPFAVGWCVYVITGFGWETWGMAPWNWALGVWGVECLCKIVDFATDTTGFPRLGERTGATENGHDLALKEHTNFEHKPIPYHNGQDEKNKKMTNGSSAKAYAPKRPQTFKEALLDALSLSCAWRGIGWEHGRDTYVPPFPFTHLEGAELRRRWLKHALWEFLKAFLALDAIEVLVKLHPNFRHPGPASIYVSSLPPIQRYPLAILTAFLTGLAVILGFQMCYHLIALLSVLLLQHSPRAWPPIFDAPWRSTSLHDYWSKRWHQLFRRMFMVMGGYPTAWFLSLVFGKAAAYVGVVVGTFLASGVYHTLSLYPTGVRLGWGSMVYFSMQGVGLGLERLWRFLTGRRVNGWAGWGWVFMWTVVGSTLAVEDWHMHGLGAGIVVPPFLSPLRMVVFPLGRWIMASM